MESIFKFYSEGVVLKDKERSSWEIEVSPVETLLGVEGNLSQYKEERQVSQTTLSGQPLRSGKSTDAKITAAWFPGFNSNRATPPDVRQNERVLLFTYGNTQRYFWTSTVLDSKLRRNEHVTYKYGNKKKPLDDWGKDGAWEIDVNTYEKTLHVKTTQSDGESYAYTVKLDAKKGNFYVSDQNGQHFTLDSKGGTFTAKVSDRIILDAPTTLVTGDLVVKKSGLIHGKLNVLSTITAAAKVITKLVITGKCKGCI